MMSVSDQPITHTSQPVSMTNIDNNIVADCSLSEETNCICYQLAQQFTFQHDSEFETIIQYVKTINNGMDKCYKNKCGHENEQDVLLYLHCQYNKLVKNVHNVLQIQAQHKSFDVSKICECKPMSKQNIIKQEVLCFIPEYRFDHTKKKTMHMFHNCYNIRKYKTEAAGQFCEETWEKGDEISFFEMFCLKLFIDHDILKRESNQLRHFNCKILAIINKFGTNNFGMKLYVFRNSHMMLNPGDISFYLPLSTTRCDELAKRWCQSGETVLEIQPTLVNSHFGQAINVSKISDDPEEQEWIVGFIYSRIFNIKTWKHKVVST